MKDKLEVVTGEIGDTWYAALGIIYSNNQLIFVQDSRSGVGSSEGVSNKRDYASSYRLRSPGQMR